MPVIEGFPKQLIERSLEMNAKRGVIDRETILHGEHGLEEIIGFLQEWADMAKSKRKECIPSHATALEAIRKGLRALADVDQLY